MRQLELVTKGNTLPENAPDELEQINRRLNELRNEQTSQTAKLELIQNSYLAGKATLDQFFAEQSKIALIDQSIEMLSIKQAELQTAFEQVELKATRTINLTTAKTCATAAETAWQQYLDLWNEFDSFARQQSEALISKLAEFRQKQNDYGAAMSLVDPTIQRNIFSPSGFSGNTTEVLKELQEMGLSYAAHQIATAANALPPETEFYEPLFIAQRIAEDKRFQAAKIKQQETGSKQLTDFRLGETAA